MGRGASDCRAHLEERTSIERDGHRLSITGSTWGAAGKAQEYHKTGSCSYNRWLP